MAKNRTVNTFFWDDSYISDLEPTEKLLFIYLLTNPLTNIAGIYEIKIKQICFDTGLKNSMVETTLVKFEKDKKILYIKQYSYLVVVNWVKHQTNNKSVFEGINRIVNEETPKLVLKYAFDRLGTDWGQTVLLNLTKLNSTLLNLDLTEKSETPQTPMQIVPIQTKTIKDIFTTIPPTIEMVSERIKERGLNIDAVKFISYYETTNWYRGKNKIKNWDSCLTTWSKNNYNNNGQHQKNGFTNDTKFGESELARQKRINDELLAERGYIKINQ